MKKKSNRIVIRGYSNNPSISFLWSVLQGNLTMNTETLDLGPKGMTLIIKQNVLLPGSKYQLQLQAK